MKKLGIIIIVLTIIVYGGAYLFKSSISTQDTKSVQDVATNFFQACSAGDEAKAKVYCPYYDNLKDYAKKNLVGLEIIYIGKPYKPFWIEGLCVPYKIKLKSGEIKKFRLQIHNDNPAHVWQVDGGI